MFLSKFCWLALALRQKVIGKVYLIFTFLPLSIAGVHFGISFTTRFASAVSLSSGDCRVSRLLIVPSLLMTKLNTTCPSIPAISQALGYFRVFCRNVIMAHIPPGYSATFSGASTFCANVADRMRLIIHVRRCLFIMI